MPRSPSRLNASASRGSPGSPMNIHMVSEVCTRPKSQNKICLVCHTSYKGKSVHILVKHVKECHPEYIESLGN